MGEGAPERRWPPSGDVLDVLPLHPAALVDVGRADAGAAQGRAALGSDHFRSAHVLDASGGLCAGQGRRTWYGVYACRPHACTAISYIQRSQVFRRLDEWWDTAHSGDEVTLRWSGMSATDNYSLGPLLSLGRRAQGEPTLASALVGAEAANATGLPVRRWLQAKTQREHFDSASSASEFLRTP